MRTESFRDMRGVVGEWRNECYESVNMRHLTEPERGINSILAGARARNSLPLVVLCQPIHALDFAFERLHHGGIVADHEQVLVVRLVRVDRVVEGAAHDGGAVDDDGL